MSELKITVNAGNIDINNNSATMEIRTVWISVYKLIAFTCNMSFHSGYRRTTYWWTPAIRLTQCSTTWRFCTLRRPSCSPVRSASWPSRQRAPTFRVALAALSVAGAPLLKVRVVSIVFVWCDCESIEMWLPKTNTSTNLFSADGNFSPVLLYAAVSVVEYTSCQSALVSYGGIDPSMLCTSSTNNTDTCQGDSGGPVVCPSGGINYLAGIVSWGVGCAEGIPAVSTYVSHFSNAIYSAMANGA